MLSAGDASRVAAAFDLGEAVGMAGPVARGVIGRIWRLETDRGAWAVKEWFEPPAVDELAEGMAFQDAAMGFGVPAPPVARTPAGDQLVEIDGTLVRVQEWIDLREPDRTIDPEQVGRLLGRLHQVPFEGRQPVDPWYSEPVGADRWDGLVAASLVAGASFADRLAARRDALVALDGLVVPHRRTRTCHRDLWADNLRLTDGGDLCVIDWEDCGLADPSMELGVVLWEFGRTDPDRARALSSAYVDAGGPGRIRGPGDFSMLVAQLGHIGARACADWLGAGTEEGRAFAAAWFAEFIEEPHTMDQRTMLLEASQA